MTDNTPPLVWPAIGGGLAGAAGVALSAAAAHVDASDFVRSAAAMALGHAPLLILLAVPGIRRVIRRPVLPALMVTIGLVLFCGDMVARAFFDFSLFHYAAPTGGSLLILGWLTTAALALPALFARRKVS
ncbi:uncharacterized membrane protein YgdD (TMEM256/DUF423 family) [Breoghania corrubedonensis]|uniref:Uncharacterized membrane protein YgdD (TMEM256/DUF423 family) n=1 Tax=Breoghania corrubedonensis TaxID=665038 RepID=A0A2T5V5T4_9HYPH|nr:DUF423 domain-containing protein [Breoghania corrubedonensis]PTW59115.1 uncharacterized membrane protein YgdD (TMEM256/DUF423 family) [Breoghania corrubedonensis]